MLKPKTAATSGLSLFQYFNLAFGAAIGIAWIVLVGDWVERAGAIGAVVAFITASLLMCFIVRGYGEVAKRFPGAGGEMNYTWHALGPRMGALIGWLLIYTYGSVAAFMAASSGRIFVAIVPALQGGIVFQMAGEPVFFGELCAGLIILALLIWANIIGIRIAARVQDYLTWGKIAVALGFIICGIWFGRADNLRPLWAAREGQLDYLSILSVFAVAPLFIAGFNLAFQTVDQRRAGISMGQVVWTLMVAVLMTGLFYAGVILATSLSIERAELLGQDLPAAIAFGVVFNSDAAKTILLTAGLLGLITTWNAVMIAIPQMISALGGNGVLPPVWSRRHVKYDSPVNGIFTVAAFSAIGAIFGRSVALPLVATSSMCLGFTFWMVMLAARRLDKNVPSSRLSSVGSFTGLIASVVIFGVALVSAVRVNFEAGAPISLIALSLWLLVGAIVIGPRFAKLKVDKTAAKLNG